MAAMVGHLILEETGAQLLDIKKGRDDYDNMKLTGNWYIGGFRVFKCRFKMARILIE